LTSRNPHPIPAAEKTEPLPFYGEGIHPVVMANPPCRDWPSTPFAMSISAIVYPINGNRTEDKNTKNLFATEEFK
jgi:hypothetical protein